LERPSIFTGTSIGAYLLFTKPGDIHAPYLSPQNASVSVQLQLSNGKIIALSASQLPFQIPGWST